MTDKEVLIGINRILVSREKPGDNKRVRAVFDENGETITLFADHFGHDTVKDALEAILRAAKGQSD